MTLSHGETVRAAVAAAAAQVVATVREQRRRGEQLFSAHFLFLYNPGAQSKRDGSFHDQQV